MKSPYKNNVSMSAGVIATGIGVGLFIAVTIFAHAQTGLGNTISNVAATSTTSQHLPGAKTTPTLAIIVSTSSAPVGTSVHARAVLSNMTATASGTVAYTIYADNRCTRSVQDAGVKNVTDAYVPKSNAFFFHVAASYFWQAVYSGDIHNSKAVSSCQNGRVTLFSTIVTAFMSEQGKKIPGHKETKKFDPGHWLKSLVVKEKHYEKNKQEQDEKENLGDGVSKKEKHSAQEED